MNRTLQCQHLNLFLQVTTEMSHSLTVLWLRVIEPEPQFGHFMSHDKLHAGFRCTF